jgi:hypothetical protein
MRFQRKRRSGTIAILLNYLIGVEYLVIQSEQTQLILSMFVLFIVSPAFVYGTVYPRYREIYPEATFFRNKVWILLALVTFILLILGVLYLTMTA